MSDTIDGISLADYPVIDEDYIREAIGDADILMIGCKACGSTHNLVSAHDLTKLMFVCADCGAPIGHINLGEEHPLYIRDKDGNIRPVNGETERIT